MEHSIAIAAFFLLASSCFNSGVGVNDSFTLNVSFTLNSFADYPVDYNSPDLNFYALDAFYHNASVLTFNPYAYLCFISSDAHTFTLSICLNHSQLHTVIAWSANRVAPATGKLITLALQEDGDLVLQGDSDMAPVWRTHTANNGVVTMELVQYPINLVLYDNEGEVVWQSMNNPSDTLTALQTLKSGMKLTSWASPSNPSEGHYSLLVHTGFVTLSYTGSNASSTTTYWEWSPECFGAERCGSSDTASISRLGFVLGSNFDSLGYPILTCRPSLDQSNNTFLRLESDGTLHLYALTTNQWDNLCDVPSASSCGLPFQCGPYGICQASANCACPNASFFAPMNPSDLTQGCYPILPLVGRNDSKVNNTSLLDSIQMLEIHGHDYFSNAFNPPVSGISSEETCQAKCLSNCACVAAFWITHYTESNCFHVNDEIGSLQGSKNESQFRAYLKVHISPSSTSGQIPPPSITGHISPPSTSGHRLKLGIIIGSSILVFFIASSLIYCKLRRDISKNLDEDEDVIMLDNTILKLPTRYTYTELQAITHNFSKLLGKGGSGTVYAGTLDDGTKVAVKQLLESLRQGDKEFRSEMAIMAGIHHYNLLRLLGFCAQGKRRLLVYEYMENGSLDQWLFDYQGDDGKPLAWVVRFKIAVGIAKGLAYLHQDCREKIIHLDIKPQNILLDRNLVPKVADFGLSKPIDREKSKVMTIMRGTPGYLAPEWIKERPIDEKCDVFSFGMVLLEIISGRKNEDHTQENLDRIYYPEWAFRQAQAAELNQASGRMSAMVLNLTNAELLEEEEVMQLWRMIKTAFLCVLEEPTLRPSMEQVVQMLEGVLDVMSIQLSSLLQGLLSVLSNTAGFNHMQEAIRDVLAARNVVIHPSSSDNLACSNTLSSLEISAR